MPQLNVTIPEDLNKKVRDKAGQKFGAAKNSITLGVIEALTEWVNKPEAK
jgi:hypothetical protein